MGEYRGTTKYTKHTKRRRSKVGWAMTDYIVHALLFVPFVLLTIKVFTRREDLGVTDGSHQENWNTNPR